VFRDPPSPSELPTCDTAGVLGPAAAIVAAFQSIEAIRLLVGEAPRALLTTFDFWNLRTRTLAVEIDPGCPACGKQQFDFLDAPAGDSAVTLCGRNAVQVRPSGRAALGMDALAERLGRVGSVQRSPYFIKCALAEPAGVVLTVFPDSRALVQGVNDLARAKSIYARFVGS
jgi:adenylyltransferase/sulfurtransferase